MKILLGPTAAVALAVSAAAAAHHSPAMFDRGALDELSGTVREFQWTNPHTWIQVYVEDESGERVEWSIEWGGPNSLARRGYRPDTFEPGAEVSIRFHPHVQGAPAGEFVAARLADGTTIGEWD